MRAEAWNVGYVEPGLAPGGLWHVQFRPDGTVFLAAAIELDSSAETAAENDAAWVSEGGVACVYDGDTGELLAALGFQGVMVVEHDD